MKRKLSLSKNSFYFGIFLLVLVDQAIKWYYRSIGSYVLNTGVSFGLLSFNDFWIVACLVIIALIVLVVKNKNLGFLLVMAGGIGNLIDRVLFGGVVDHWQLFNLWFNLSDLLINIGVVIIFWYEYRSGFKHNL